MMYFIQAENHILREEIEQRTQAELERLTMLKRQVITERVILQSDGERHNLQQLSSSPLRSPSLSESSTTPSKGQCNSTMTVPVLSVSHIESREWSSH